MTKLNIAKWQKQNRSLSHRKATPQEVAGRYVWDVSDSYLNVTIPAQAGRMLA